LRTHRCSPNQHKQHGSRCGLADSGCVQPIPTARQPTGLPGWTLCRSSKPPSPPSCGAPARSLARRHSCTGTFAVGCNTGGGLPNHVLGKPSVDARRPGAQRHQSPPRPPGCPALVERRGLRHSTSHPRVAPTRSNRRRSSDGTPSAVVCASHGWGTTCPSSSTGNSHPSALDDFRAAGQQPCSRAGKGMVPVSVYPLAATWPQPVAVRSGWGTRGQGQAQSSPQRELRFVGPVRVPARWALLPGKPLHVARLASAEVPSEPVAGKATR